MHRLATSLAAAGILLVGGIRSGPSEEADFPATTNAALRYWMAFAHMENPPEREGVAQLLEQTAAGMSPWNEPRLGPILDSNREAIEMMQRATALPECSWGIEYERGPDAAISHLARGRALARLNVLQGLRLESRQDMGGAVESWLRGLRFALDLGRDGTLLAALVSRSSLSAHLAPLIRVVGEGKADDWLPQIEDTVRRLPAYGPDWVGAVSRESAGLDTWLGRLLQAPPEEASQELARDLAAAGTGEAGRAEIARLLGLRAADLGSAEKLRSALRLVREEHKAFATAVAAAYRFPYLQAEGSLGGIESKRAGLSAATQSLVFDPTRANHARAELEADRAALISLVSLRRRRLETGADPMSLAGLGAPNDPFTGKPFELVATSGGFELRSSARDSKRASLVYRLRR